MATPPTGGVSAAVPAPAAPARRRLITPLRVAIALGIAAAAGGLGFWGLGARDSGTLLASGVLAERDRLVLAEFENRTSDSTLGPSVSEALRIDLSQSPTVRLLDAAAIAAALQRMNQPAGTRIDVALARDIAQREGAKAVVRGHIDPVGPGYVLAGEVVAAQNGAVLAALRETAQNDGELIDAVDRLSKRLRRQIGESLKTIRASTPLQRVTTGSLEALKRYSQAIEAEGRGEWDRAAALLEQAIALDTGFAMAHRKLAAILFNTFGSQSRATAAATSAFRHRDRLPPLERHLTTAYYYTRVEPDREQGAAAYRAALQIDPDDFVAANNLTLLYNELRQFAAAESLALRHLGTANFSIYFNLAQAQLAQGKVDDAAASVRAFELAAPGNPAGIMMRAFIAENRDAYDSAEAIVRSLPSSQLDLATQGWRTQHLFALALVRGRLKAAAAEARRFMEVSEQRRLPGSYLIGGIQIALIQLRFEGQPVAAKRTVAIALRRHPLDSLQAADRPYTMLVMFYAESGQLERARSLLAEYDSVTPAQRRRADEFRHAAVGALAFADGRWDEALRAYRAWYDESWCARCGLNELARIYDQLGRQDSAVVIAERGVTNLGLYRVFEDTWTLAGAYKRLGELYEQRGDTTKARGYYGKFVDLWKDADPVLQPAVRDVRERLAKLAGEQP